MQNLIFFYLRHKDIDVERYAKQEYESADIAIEWGLMWKNKQAYKGKYVGFVSRANVFSKYREMLKDFSEH